MTTLDYLQNTDCYESEAKIINVRETEKGLAILLDRTIFYPQGGGQPADHGTITSENGAFIVSDTRLDELGNVYHYGEYESGTLNKDETVTLKIDVDRRQLNAKLHSAGHLLDIALVKMGLTDLIPAKGFHYPEGPYIQYEGTLENPQELIPELEKTVNEMVAEKLPIHAKELTQEEAQTKGIYAPPGKAARVVNFEGYDEFGCGGTHVHDSSELGHITIRKISSKKGRTNIAYALD